MAVFVAVAGTGCSSAVALEPAVHAASVGCASVVAHLPATVAGLDQRNTNAQGTGAWGTPTEVLLRCGVAVPGPTSTLGCVTVSGIDWLTDDTHAPDFVFTSYGRSPAVQVVIAGDKKLSGAKVNGSAVLSDLGPAVRVLPRTRRCTTPGADIENGAPVDPTPAAP